MISALLLDLDGTLVDSEPLHRRGYELCFAARGWNVPDLGIFTADPRTHKTATLIPKVERITKDVEEIAGGSARGGRGTGGMVTKLEAARLATGGGSDVYIAGGHERDALQPRRRGSARVVGTAHPRTRTAPPSHPGPSPRRHHATRRPRTPTSVRSGRPRPGSGRAGASRSVRRAGSSTSPRPASLHIRPGSAGDATRACRSRRAARFRRDHPRAP